MKASEMTTESLLSNEHFQASYAKKIAMGIKPIGVYELLPDNTNVWTDDHILIDFARKPMSKSQTIKSASSAVLMQVYDEDDASSNQLDEDPSMFMVAPKGDVNDAAVRTETQEYTWWRDYHWNQKKSKRSIYNQRFLMRKDGEQYLYNMTKGNIKLTRKINTVHEHTHTHRCTGV